MSLNNLVGKTLEKITPDHANIKRILNAAKRNIADSKIKQTSVENRFDAAYKAIMQLANVAFWVLLVGRATRSNPPSGGTDVKRDLNIRF